MGGCPRPAGNGSSTTVPAHAGSVTPSIARSPSTGPKLVTATIDRSRTTSTRPFGDCFSVMALSVDVSRQIFVSSQFAALTSSGCMANSDGSRVASPGIKRTVRGVYRLQTMSHPELGGYLSWRSAPPASGWRLTRQAARVWYACDGSLSAAGRDGGTSQISFAAMDERKRHALVAALGRAGFTASSWRRRVGLSAAAVGEWLDWVGEPTPGSEHKWRL
jgi:hypothetical protein